MALVNNLRDLIFEMMQYIPFFCNLNWLVKESRILHIPRTCFDLLIK